MCFDDKKMPGVWGAVGQAMSTAEGSRVVFLKEMIPRVSLKGKRNQAGQRSVCTSRYSGIPKTQI